MNVLVENPNGIILGAVGKTVDMVKVITFFEDTMLPEFKMLVL